MGDVLSALIPPAVVAAVFCTFIIKLLRREMAPRTSDGRLVRNRDRSSVSDGASTAAASSGGSAAGEDGADSDEDGSAEGRGNGPDTAGR